MGRKERERERGRKEGWKGEQRWLDNRVNETERDKQD
jgi:hypothetical protein